MLPPSPSPNADAAESNDPSTPEEIAKEIADLEEKQRVFLLEKQDSEKAIRFLRQEENPAEGVFYAQEIYAKQQDKLRLEVEAEFCRKRINRLRLRIEEG